MVLISPATRLLKISLVMFALFACDRYIEPHAAQAETFTTSESFGPSSPTAESLAFIGKLIRERTGGKYSINLIAQAEQGSDPFIIQKLKLGNVAMARIRLDSFHDFVPASMVLTMPYIFRSQAHLQHVLDGAIGHEILAEFEAAGFIGLCFYETGLRSFYGPKKAIRNASDLKGLNIRVPPSDTIASLLQSAGASPKGMPLSLVDDALKAGTIDIAEGDLLGYRALKHYEVAKLYSPTDHSRGLSAVVFSKRIWDSLSKENQTVIRDAAAESVPVMREAWGRFERRAHKDLEGAAGVQFVTDIDKKSLSDLLKPLSTLHASDAILKSLQMIERVQ